MAQLDSLSEGARRILSIAAPLFAEKGYTGVSINDIAAATDGSKANIYHHFPNKEALYLSVFKSACDEFGAELKGSADERSDNDNRLQIIGKRHLLRLFSKSDSVRLILREVLDSESGINRSLVAEILHVNFGTIVEQIEEEQRQGRIRDDVNPAMAAVTIVALNMFFFQSMTILEQFPEFRHLDSPQQFAKEAFDTIAKGLLVK